MSDDLTFIGIYCGVNLYAGTTDQRVVDAITDALQHREAQPTVEDRLRLAQAGTITTEEWRRMEKR